MRRNLVGKNNVQKYILYAIGEIILVVIGILIALQINTWNENKRLREDEIYILTEIMDNLQKDESQIEAILNRRENAQISIERIIRDIPEKVVKDTFEVDMGRVVTLERFYPFKTAYEVSKAKGLQISNKELRSAIAQYYEYEINRSNSSIKDVENAFVNDLQFLVEDNFDNIDYGNRITFLDLENPEFLKTVKSAILKYRANHELSLDKIRSFYQANLELQEKVHAQLSLYGLNPEK